MSLIVSTYMVTERARFYESHTRVDSTFLFA